MEQQIRFNQLRASVTRDNKLMYVGHLLSGTASRYPDNIAVICQQEQVSYNQLLARSQAFADLLHTRGVQEGDRVVLWYENSIPFFYAYYAVWHVGAVIAPLNVFLHEEEFTGILTNAQPKAVIISDEHFSKLSSEGQKHLVSTFGTLLFKTTDILTAPEPTQILPIPDRDAEKTAAILYTSGTTGFPKGVMLTSKNILINTIQGISRSRGTSQDRVFCALPLFHCYSQNACVWANVVMGSTAIIVPKIERSSIFEGLSHRPTFVLGVPVLYGLFCQLKTANFDDVRYFYCGGDSLSDKIRAGFELIYGRKLCNGYGLTETSPFISVDLDDSTKPTGCIGKPLYGITVDIRDEAEKPVETGTIGVLWVRSETIMEGYYNAPEATQKIIKDGWLNTGDLAYISPTGDIVLCGRERDIISNKGVKIYPPEVENVLLSHPHVNQAAVIGKKTETDEYPIAYIASTAQDHEALSRELIEFCSRKLAAYKVPREIIVEKELPLTSTGKIDKKKLTVPS